MKEIIEWLLGIERMAGDLYRDAAFFFKEDKALSDFLRELGEDEAWHFQIMGSAAAHLEAHPETPAQIALDDATRRRTESPFEENRLQLATGNLTKESILSCIVATEFSEWNDLFLYVVTSFQEEDRSFQHVAARMQGHLKHIMDFLEKIPEGLPFLHKIKDIPPVWQEKILIVEDSEALRFMLERVFVRDYRIASAENGFQGLEKVKEGYVDVVVSDIEMPEMNGIAFLQEALKLDPGIAGRFLFFSGFISEEHQAFLHAHQVPHLMKPAKIEAIKRKVAEILERNRHQSSALSHG